MLDTCTQTGSLGHFTADDAWDSLPTPLSVIARERYAIEGLHAHGGVGRVLRARDRQLGRVVALKELIRRGSCAELRFEREIQLTARLQHPGIVTLLDAGRWPDGTPFYTMKLVPGSSLRASIAAQSSSAARLALLPHVVAVADALAYAHRERIIHRDIKPSNILLGPYGETIIVDWGLAIDLSPLGSPARAQGGILGTPGYMAPEQAQGGYVDERSDIYALGGLMREVLCLADSRLPLELVAVMERATAARAGDRFASADDFATALRSALASSYVRRSLS